MPTKTPILKQRTLDQGFKPGVRVLVQCGFENTRKGLVQRISDNGTITVSPMEDGRMDMKNISPLHATILPPAERMMTLSRKTEPIAARYKIYDARDACYNWFDGEASAMHQAVFDDAEVDALALLKEAKDSLKQAAKFKNPTKDLEALIWYCERHIKGAKVKSMMQEAAKLAVECGWNYVMFYDGAVANSQLFTIDN